MTKEFELTEEEQEELIEQLEYLKNQNEILENQNISQEELIKQLKDENTRLQIYTEQLEQKLQLANSNSSNDTYEDIQILVNEIDKLERSNISKETKIQQLQFRLQNLEIRYSKEAETFNSEISLLKADLLTSKESIQNLEKENKQISSILSHYEAENNDLHSKILDMKLSSRTLRPDSSGTRFSSEDANPLDSEANIEQWNLVSYPSLQATEPQANIQPDNSNDAHTNSPGPSYLKPNSELFLFELQDDSSLNEDQDEDLLDQSDHSVDRSQILSGGSSNHAKVNSEVVIVDNQDTKKVSSLNDRIQRYLEQIGGQKASKNLTGTHDEESSDQVYTDDILARDHIDFQRIQRLYRRPHTIQPRALPTPSNPFAKKPTLLHWRRDPVKDDTSPYETDEPINEGSQSPSYLYRKDRGFSDAKNRIRFLSRDILNDKYLLEKDAEEEPEAQEEEVDLVIRSISSDEFPSLTHTTDPEEQVKSLSWQSQKVLLNRPYQTSFKYDSPSSPQGEAPDSPEAKIIRTAKSFRKNKPMRTPPDISSESQIQTMLRPPDLGSLSYISLEGSIGSEQRRSSTRSESILKLEDQMNDGMTMAELSSVPVLRNVYPIGARKQRNSEFHNPKSYI